MFEKNIFEMVETFLIVDDKEENRKAFKKAVREIFPDKKVLEASSAKKAKEVIAENSDAIDFVLSDMQMEEDVSGFYVAFEAWSWFIPAVVVTAGDHHGAYVTASVLCNSEIGEHNLSIKPATKDDAEVWKSIIRGTEKRNGPSIQAALYVRSKEKGKSLYSRDAGELMAHMVCSGMGDFRNCQI